MFRSSFVLAVVLIGLIVASVACVAPSTPTAARQEPAAAAAAPQAAQQAPAVSAPAPLSIQQATLLEQEKTAEVSTDELRQLLESKTALVFDARPFNEYATSHIPGALNVAPKPGVPMSQYVSDVAEIGRLAPDKNTPLVLYCNGPFCGKSKRLSEELLQAGYTNVRRYQLGIPTWRALVGLTQIEREAVKRVLEQDKTAVVIDARGEEEFKAGSLTGARRVPLAGVAKAKDDGRLPMEDHNTRIIVVGKDGAEARAVAESIAKNAFHNVSFFNGSYDALK